MKDLLTRVIEGLIVIGILYICLTAGGCSTVHGFGQDLQDWTATNTQ